MEYYSLLKALSALAFVIGLFYVCLLVFKKYVPHFFEVSPKSPRNLKIEDHLVLSPKHKVVLVSYENTKYLLLLGATEVVIDKIKCSKNP